MLVDRRPRFTPADAEALALERYGVAATATELPSERDQNFRLDRRDGPPLLLKIAHPDEAREVLEFQQVVLEHLARQPHAERYPRLLPSLRGESLLAVDGPDGRHLVRLLSYLPGRPLATVERLPRDLPRQLGRALAELDLALAEVAHPAMTRPLQWDSRHAAATIRANLDAVPAGPRRELLERTVVRVENRLAQVADALPRSVIHNDVNDHNLLVDEDGRICGIIDFGDMLHTFTACEPANAAAYLLMHATDGDPWEVLLELLGAYHAVRPLTDAEREAVVELLLARLALSVAISARQQQLDPDNSYLTISEAPAWALLGRLWAAVPDEAVARLQLELQVPSMAPPAPLSSRRSADELVRLRRAYLGPSLSLSYRQPLKIVRGRGVYLYAEDGRRYLDCVNNVCHVGHCHPRVVTAGQRQLALLNTNTRYLHDHLVEYAQRLTATLPEPLRVCFLVNSGSEANDLALRLARTATGRRDMIVIDHAYHGNLSSLIDISPYKFADQGGGKAPPETHVVSMPDGLRGRFRYGDPDAGPGYAAEIGAVLAQLQAQGRGVAGFIAESLLGCGGQIELPPGYLAAAYEQVRAAGGLCIADEVQVGFGRVGSHRWGFETQGVVPDIVTMGKPIGNGHPLAAVVTTPEIAAAFDTGMEYFNTFGGNPVSCAIGLAVLDVLEQEGLQQRALEVGGYFERELGRLAQRYPQIIDVRGRGLFLGVELVRDPKTLEPAAAEAGAVVEAMKERGVLLSIDGPLHNVLKIKPPLVFGREHVDEVVAGLDQVLGEVFEAPV